jgi:hypothetical protein
MKRYDMPISRLRRMAREHTAAAEEARSHKFAKRILLHRTWICHAAECLEELATENAELRERLVRQAVFYECREARQYPLLNDDDPGESL